ncbi:hypothetical protein [Hansschlegelia zhihuaiae]|uniref:Uncharacterized protein n=1 Tax=Hansschlegelia zhihuaiae TaxID=405005 RepID=A0A4Q0MIJ3_9HYPH|nr:hypothetical protein [Hansschlegelia zhihuaiae]RXF72859.1 hypothetical protein EK403_13605 [Hansschlegelia zhihuaiae]
MTGRLDLSIELDERRGFSTSGVAVRIESANDRPDLDAKTWTVLVPTGSRGLFVDVPAGSYTLQAWLPSGQILRRAATVKDDQIALVVFVEKKLKTGMARDRAWQDRTFDLHKEFHPLEFQPAYSSGSDPFAGETATAQIDFLHERASNLSWSRLPLAEHVVDELKLHLLEGETSTDIASNAELTVISIKATRSTNPDMLTWCRHWVRVQNANGASIGALPLPWLTSAVGDSRPQIEVSYEHHQQHLEIAVRDHALDLLLAYMKLGRLSAAEMSIDLLSHEGTLLRALEDKRGNPLAACAAAYVSLATANKKQIDIWRDWAPNLMNWFPWMPDGAIIRACALMDGPVSKDAKEQILTCAKEGYRRGLPFFTVGVQHLREILQLFGGDDPEAEEMLGSVRSVSSRCDISEAFTTLQFPSH